MEAVGGNGMSRRLAIIIKCDGFQVELSKNEPAGEMEAQLTNLYIFPST